MNEEVVGERKDGRTALWMVLVGIPIGFAYSLVILYISPQKFESSTIVEFRKPPAALAEDEWSVANEVALITSPKLFRDVSEELNLYQKWKMETEQLVIILSSITEVEAVDESDFQKITVRHASPETARDVAHEIPKSYLRRKAADRGLKLDLKQRDFEAQILRREDLVDHAGRTLREMLGDVGLVLASGDQLESSTLADFYQSHPEKKEAAQGVGLDQYNAAWRDYASEQDTLKRLQKEKNRALFGEAESHVEVVVHGEAVRPKIAVFPNYAEGLWWGLLKGLIFGLVLGALTLVFCKMKKGGEERGSKPGRKKSDPADTW